MSDWVELKISARRDKVLCPCGAEFENSLAGIREARRHIANGECARTAEQGEVENR